ncbi:hypothetical protein TNCV_723481 [Trichonephila clavipes]|nr:hypothetical protein TNCV_723481 [Trichonephila clavipes]
MQTIGNNNDLLINLNLDTPFTCDSSLITNTASQSSESMFKFNKSQIRVKIRLLRPLAQHIYNYKCPDTSQPCQV